MFIARQTKHFERQEFDRAQQLAARSSSSDESGPTNSTRISGRSQSGSPQRRIYRDSVFRRNPPLLTIPFSNR